MEFIAIIHKVSPAFVNNNKKVKEMSQYEYYDQIHVDIPLIIITEFAGLSASCFLANLVFKTN